MATGEYDSAKQEEFKRDTVGDYPPLDAMFKKISSFCIEQNKTNCFLIEKNASGKEIDLIHELVDLKLLHLIRSRVTVRGKTGKIYEAYMIDFSQYAGARKRRGLRIIEFWKTSEIESLRKNSMIFDPNELH